MSAYPNLHANAGALSTAAMSQVLLIDGREGRIEMLSIALSESWEDIAVLPVADVAAAIALIGQQHDSAARPALLVVARGESSAAIEDLRRLKLDPATAEIPALVLCPQVNAADYQRAVRLGAIELLREPETLDGYLRLAAGWQGLFARL